MAGPDAGVDKRERQSCAISERSITSERSAGKKCHEKIGTASVEEEEEGERMGRDGKLTRSLLPGALGTGNKREAAGWEDQEKGRKPRASDRLARIGRARGGR